ncbi:serpin family protein [Candidatus Poribacteria bacterium]|nr:serpin family protein [Candidatus Poribacteria bacterium]
MSKTLSLTLAICTCFLFTQCANNPILPKSKDLSQLTLAERSIVASDNQFGFKLFKEISQEKDENIFISPLSVAMALGMTYNGANGSTQEAMQKTLELSGLTLQEINESYKNLIELLTNLDPKVKFQIANSIWYREMFPVEAKFIDINKTYFDAEVSGLDFSAPNASEIINGWVKEKTNGKIEKIVDAPINPLTMMFLINAIYFKGIWTYQFDESQTQDDMFTLPDGSQKPCKMMTQESELHYFENDDFQAIDLPYGAGDFSMTILLPRLEKDINSLMAALNQETWNLWVNSFQKQELTVQLPKFTLEYELTLNDVLGALGMEIAFNRNLADFTKMYKKEAVGANLYISNVKHKTFVEVNEEGTEAAAVTSVEMTLESVPDRILMRIDRPFICAIREKRSGTILFIGKIVEPTLG